MIHSAIPQTAIIFLFILKFWDGQTHVRTDLLTICVRKVIPTVTVVGLRGVSRGGGAVGTSAPGAVSRGAPNGREKRKNINNYVKE